VSAAGPAAAYGRQDAVCLAPSGLTARGPRSGSANCARLAKTGQMPRRHATAISLG